jgi:hypothetical protein
MSTDVLFIKVKIITIIKLSNRHLETETWI